MTIGLPFGVGAISSLNTGFGDLEIWWSDFDGKNPRHLFMTGGSLAGPESRSNSRFWREAAIALDLAPQLEQFSAFRRMNGGNIADLRRVGKSGSGLSLPTKSIT